MPRIRSVHPGLFTDKAFAARSHAAQILFIGIWTECDDAGAFRWEPVELKIRLLPVANVDIAALLAELLEADMITRYARGDRAYGLVRNFMRYQRPKKPKYLHVIPDEFRAYVGMSAASGEPGGAGSSGAGEHDDDERPPVPQKAEPGPQREEEEEGKGKRRGSPPTTTVPPAARDPAPTPPPPQPAPAAASSSDRRIAEADEIAAEFLQLRQGGWPHESRLPSPLATLRIQALGFLDAGATVALVKRVMGDVAAGKRAKGEPAPTNLHFARLSIETAIARSATSGNTTGAGTRAGPAPARSAGPIDTSSEGSMAALAAENRRRNKAGLPPMNAAELAAWKAGQAKAA